MVRREKPEEAVRRGILEKTSLSSEIIEELETVSVKDETGEARCIYFLVKVGKEEVKLSEEHMNYK